MLRRVTSTKSIGRNDWVFLCSDSEEVAVQSIFLLPLAKRVVPARLKERADGLSIAPLTFAPSKASVDLLMDWAIHQGRLHNISTHQATELLWMAEEMGIHGLVDACDLWLETQARYGRLFGTSLQIQEQSGRNEMTREYWDTFADTHNLKRLSACCEAYIDNSPQGFKRQQRDLTRRLSDVSWTSSVGDRRVSVDY